VVHPPEDGAHLVVDGAHHEQHVGLARREPGQPGPESVDVVVGARRRHELHPAAGGDEGVGEDGVLPRPGDGVVELGSEELPYSHSRPPLRQMYRSPSIRMPRNTTISTKPNTPSWR